MNNMRKLIMAIIGIAAMVGVVVILTDLYDANRDVEKWKKLTHEAIDKTDQAIVLVERALSVGEACMEKLAATTTQ